MAYWCFPSLIKLHIEYMNCNRTLYWIIFQVVYIYFIFLILSLISYFKAYTFNKLLLYIYVNTGMLNTCVYLICDSGFFSGGRTESLLSDIFLLFALDSLLSLIPSTQSKSNKHCSVTTNHIIIWVKSKQSNIVDGNQATITKFSQTLLI